MAAQRPFFMGYYMSSDEITPSHIRMAAMNLLAMREHSTKELYTKLTKKFEHKEWVKGELERLQNDGLQSDRRYAEAFINMRLRQGKGALVIRLELKEKGVAETIISEHLTVHNDWNDLALQAYIKKFGNKPMLDIKEKSRRMRFLAARGFSTANIQYAMNHSLAMDDE
jgi:regulatory protein